MPSSGFAMGGGITLQRPQLTTSSLPSGTQGSAYSFQLTAIQGVPPYSFGASGLPAGLTCSNSGLISGTPTVFGTFTVVASVVDSLNAPSAPTSLTLSVAQQQQPAGGFIPAAGFGSIGTPAFDQPFTITNASNPFGANGPTLLMFDDFRNGTQGVAVANNTPGVAGSSNWLNSIAAGGNSVYQGPNRSGGGNCLRIRKSGDSDVTYEALNLQFANTNAFYMFFAENSHGVDYNTLTGAGTGNNWNYKLNWLMFNNITAHAFNMVMMDIIASAGSSFQQFGSNDSTSSGGPLPLWDSGSGASYDNNNWTSIEYGYVADPNNPTTAPGIMFHAEYCQRNSGRHGATSTGASPNGATTNVLFNSGSGSAGTYSVANSLAFPGLIEGAPSTLVIDRADVYVAIGPNCLKRFFIGDQATIAACTTIMPCTIDSWSAGSVTMTLRQGAFSQLAGNYLYGSWDGANTIVPVGQFTPPITFDFFISTTGSDSNAGTLASPWAITSFINTSPNYSKLSGKKIGMIAGTYNVAGTAGVAGATKIGHGTFPTNNSYCALTVPPGPNSSTPTYVASCDTSGNYSPRAATIFLVSGQVSASGNVWYNGIMGCGEDYPSGAFVTIDGIVINGNGMDGIAAGNEGAHLFFFQTATGSFTAAATNTPGPTVQNCEAFGITATDNGGNDAGIWMQAYSSGLIHGCYVHDINKDAADASHCHGAEFYGCQGITIEYCTFANCSGGAVEPKEGCANITVQYNYIYNCGTATIGNTAVFQAFDGAQGNPNTPNIANNIHHNILDSCGRAKRGESNNDLNFMGLNVYNNTVYDTRSGVTDGGWILVTNGSVGTILQHYNNIYVASQNGGDHGSGQGTSAGKTCVTKNAMAVLDYNDYYSVNASYTAMWGVGGTSFSTLANWQTNSGGDTHGATSDPQFIPGTASIVAGGGPGQFKLNSGSGLIGAARVGGVPTGGAINTGAWDGTVTQIGCGFGPHA